MSTNNKVFQILVTKGDAGLPSAGDAVSTLADGQIGLFNAETNLAVDASAMPKAVYFAVGVHKGGVLSDINTSAGQVIQLENLKDINVKNYVAGKPFNFEIGGSGILEWDTEYAVKFEFRNMQVYMRQGYNQFAKTYSIKTDVGDPTTPPTVEYVIGKFLAAFNADTSGMFTAVPVKNEVAITYGAYGSSLSVVTVIGSKTFTTTILSTDDTGTKVAAKVAATIDADSALTASATGAVVTVTGIPSPTPAITVTGVTGTVAGPTVISSGITGATGIKVTANSIAVQEFCSINTMYYNPRQTIIIPSLIEKGASSMAVSTLQEPVDEQGAGYDIAQKEYHAGGWNGRPGPYRASTALGLAMPGFKYFADKSATYNQFNLVYDQASTAGWGEYLNNLMTTIAVPSGSTTTRAALVTMLNAMAAKAGTSVVKAIS